MCLRIGRLLIVVLAFLSSRTSIFSPGALAYDWKRPRPSRQALPTHPVRPTTDEEATGGPAGVHPRMSGELQRPSGIPPVISWTSHLHLRAETTKPDYLQFFRSTGAHHYLSPPA
jgi:hypothetical protein